MRPPAPSPIVGGMTEDLAHQLWAHCPTCGRWFLVEHLELDTMRLCPVDLVRADTVEWR